MPGVTRTPMPEAVATLAAERSLGELRLTRREPPPIGRIVGGLTGAIVGAVLIVLYAADFFTDTVALIAGIALFAVSGLPAIVLLVVTLTVEQRLYLFDDGLIHTVSHRLQHIRWSDVDRVTVVTGKKAGSFMEFWQIFHGHGPAPSCTFAFHTGGEELTVECDAGEPFDVELRQRLEAAQVPIDHSWPE